LIGLRALNGQFRQRICDKYPVFMGSFFHLA
jgi:hypothetical protein